MIIVKVTTGYVIQEWDTEKKRFVGQCFIAGDEVNYETTCGDPVDSTNKEALEMDYMKFDMVQPSQAFPDGDES